MPLSKNEIRRRATAFAHEWRDAHNEEADAKSFWDGFLQVFGIPRRRVAVFEQLVKKLDQRHGYINPCPLLQGQRILTMAGKNTVKHVLTPHVIWSLLLTVGYESQIRSRPGGSSKKVTDCVRLSVVKSSHNLKSHSRYKFTTFVRWMCQPED